MTKGEIQAVIFVAASMLAGAVILLVKQYEADFLPDLGSASARGRLDEGIEIEPALPAADHSNARIPSTRPGSGNPAAGQDLSNPIAGTAARSASAAVDLLVPVNSAPASELQKLPGIGPKLAEAIIVYRTQSGPFARVEQLLEVKGIGPAKLGRMRPFVELK